MKDMSLDIVNNTWVKHNGLGRGTSIEHLARYVFAIKLINGSVLDVGCGTGYGSFLLSHFADRVIGVDYDEDALAIARKHWSNSNIEYHCMDLNDLSIDQYDSFVMFECLEHLINPTEILLKVKKGLNANGIGVISVPVDLPDEHHKVVYNDLNRMIEVVKPAFNRMDLYFQIAHNIIHFDKQNDIMLRITPSFVIFVVQQN